jgi:hypothetical protein
LEKFSLKGRVISKDKVSEKNEPMKDLQISAYYCDPLLNQGVFLGQENTDPNGYFQIEFDESKFSAFLSHLKTPSVYLIIKDKQGNEILEIEYHIRVIDDKPSSKFHFLCSSGGGPLATTFLPVEIR